MIPERQRRIFDPLSLALAFVLACLVWVYVDDRRIEIREFEIPLLVQVPEEWELDQNRLPPTSFTARLQGPREQMKALRPADLKVRKVLTPPAAEQDSLEIELTIQDRDIRTPPSVVVVNKELHSITVTAVKLVPQYIRIKPILVGDPAPGYRVLTATAEPRIVKVDAPKGVLNFGDSLECYPVDISGKSQSLGLTVGVKNAIIGGRMIRSNTDVWVSVVIEPIPERRVLEKVPVRILYGPLLGLRITKIHPATVSLEVEGPQALVQKLTERDPIVYADLVDVTGPPQGEHSLPLRTVASPEVVVKTLTPPEVTVTIR